MAFEVRVYRPNKDGKLEYEKKLSQDELSQMHWDKFNRDNKYALNYADKSEYSRIKIAVKKCIEPDCDQIVKNPQALTCSSACRLQRSRKNSKKRARSKRSKS
jgi:hypothetical protein|tara:strand:+ start:174 stop:482 length:309 start_codon:yes stop_codon:yes gene_type:complete